MMVVIDESRLNTACFLLLVRHKLLQSVENNMDTCVMENLEVICGAGRMKSGRLLITSPVVPRASMELTVDLLRKYLRRRLSSSHL